MIIVKTVSLALCLFTSISTVVRTFNDADATVAGISTAIFWAIFAAWEHWI